MKTKGIKALILVVILAVCITLVILLDVSSYLQRLITWADGIGTIGRVVYIFFYAAAAILFVPGSILTLGAGYLFGLGEGVIVVAIGATIGAAGAFVVGKYFMTDWIRERTSHYPKFQSVYHAIGKEGGKIIFFLRLSPLFPFSASNYLYSLTSVRFIPYVVATFFGILPGTVMYVYFGTLIESLTDLAGEGRERSPLEWILYGVGLVATVFITIYATRIAKKAIAKSVT